jgi:hypothetical protein
MTQRQHCSMSNTYLRCTFLSSFPGSGMMVLSTDEDMMFCSSVIYSMCSTQQRYAVSVNCVPALRQCCNISSRP